MQHQLVTIDIFLFTGPPETVKTYRELPTTKWYSFANFSYRLPEKERMIKTIQDYRRRFRSQNYSITRYFISSVPINTRHAYKKKWSALHQGPIIDNLVIRNFKYPKKCKSVYWLYKFYFPPYFNMGGKLYSHRVRFLS